MRTTSARGDIEKTAEEMPLLVDSMGLMKMLQCGRPTACQIGTQAGARVQIGRRVLWNVAKIQKHLDLMSV